MCWDIPLDYGIELGTCHGVVITTDAALWDEGPLVFKYYLDQARELLESARDFEMALHGPGNPDKSLQEIYTQVVSLTQNEFTPILLRAFEKSYTQEQEFRQQRTEHKKQIPAKNGYVYLLKGEDYYKIGHSQQVDKRIDQISPALPFEVEILLVIKTDDMQGLESHLHEQFTDKRTNGEWFALSEDDVQYLKNLAEFAQGEESIS